MVDFEYKNKYKIEDLRQIVSILRSPGGCPWDQEQTHASIRRNLLEEAYEAAEAIDENSEVHLKEELGDVLLQVFFHTSIEEDAGRFNLDDVADGVCKKLISFKIDPEKCIGCGMCARNCPADAIHKTSYVAPGHKLPSMEIDPSKCVKCGACMASCKKIQAISKG